MKECKKIQTFGKPIQYAKHFNSCVVEVFSLFLKYCKFCINNKNQKYSLDNQLKHKTESFVNKIVCLVRTNNSYNTDNGVKTV